MKDAYTEDKTLSLILKIGYNWLHTWGVMAVFLF